MSEKIEGRWQVDDNEHVTFQKIIDCPGLGKEELYKRALNFFAAESGNSISVIQERDTFNGIIIAKGVFKKVRSLNTILRNSSVDTLYLIKTEVRDGRTRITMSLTQYDESVRGNDPPDIHYLYFISKQYPFNTTDHYKDLYGEAYRVSQSRALEMISAVEKALLADAIPSGKDSW
jgi:hypothetical protein